jgi:hypothetical protein
MNVTTYQMMIGGGDDNSPGTLLEVVSKRDYLLLETTLLELTKEVAEWICEDCKTIYPSSMLVSSGICVICTKCKGATMPVTMYERRKMAVELNMVMSERNDFVKNIEMRDKQIKGLQELFDWKALPSLPPKDVPIVFYTKNKQYNYIYREFRVGTFDGGNVFHCGPASYFIAQVTHWALLPNTDALPKEGKES